MLDMKKYVAPETLEEAWNTYSMSPSNTILGGCAFLRLGKKRIGTGIDLCNLNLEYIEDHDAFIEIGAMTKLREMETSHLIKSHYGKALSDAVKNIVGVSFRNTATIGGSVFGRYGFSDVLTVLLAVGAEVELYKGGHMTLERFLAAPPKFDILVAIRLPKKERTLCHYEAIRHSKGDFPILNAGIVHGENHVRLTVGARPMRAEIAHKASAYLNEAINKHKAISQDAIDHAARLASDELSFGSNMRASADYRKHLCQVLVKRCIKEVTHGN